MQQNENTTVNAEATAEVTTKKKNKALSITINVILVLAILLGIFCSFTAFVAKNGNGVPSFFGIRPFSIQTDSMKPFFSKGDLIIDTEVKDPKELKVGDVITFWTVIQGERVLNSHRIIGIDDYDTFRSFTTKGDNNTIEDSMTVHQSEIVGKYWFHIPGVGAVIDFLQTSLGFGLIIVLPCAIFFVYEAVVFFKALFGYQAIKTKVQYEAEAEAKAEEKAKAEAEERARLEAEIRRKIEEERKQAEAAEQSAEKPEEKSEEKPEEKSEEK